MDSTKKSPPYVMVRGLSDTVIKDLKHLAINRNTSVNGLLKRVIEKLLENSERTDAATSSNFPDDLI